MRYHVIARFVDPMTGRLCTNFMSKSYELDGENPPSENAMTAARWARQDIYDHNVEYNIGGRLADIDVTPLAARRATET